MRNKFITVTVLFYFSPVIYAQRYAGYGRGIDWDGSPHGDSSITIYLFIFGLFLVLAFIGAIITAFKSRGNNKPSKSYLIVDNGYIRPLTNEFNKHLIILRTWSLQEFEKQFGELSIKTEKDKITRLVYTKNYINTYVEVHFECTSDTFYKAKKLGIVQTAGGGYLLYREDK